jgi:hypothetical protein
VGPDDRQLHVHHQVTLVGREVSRPGKVLQAMRDRLEELERLGVEAIND